MSADIGESFARTKELCELMSKDIRIQIKMDTLMRPCRWREEVIISQWLCAEKGLIYDSMDSDANKSGGSVCFTYEIIRGEDHERRRCQKIRRSWFQGSFLAARGLWWRGVKVRVYFRTRTGSLVGRQARETKTGSARTANQSLSRTKGHAFFLAERS